MSSHRVSTTWRARRCVTPDVFGIMILPILARPRQDRSGTASHGAPRLASVYTRDGCSIHSPSNDPPDNAIGIPGVETLALPKHVLPTPVVGSYPQPDWLVDRQMLSKSVPRTRMTEMWRIPEAYLEQAQDDATIVAIRDMERAGIDIVTDGEIRRESYSNRFATALEGVDADNPAMITARSGQQTPVPRVVGKIKRTGPVELRDMQFLRKNTDRAAKITLPGPFTMSQQAKNEFYKDDEELAMAFAEAATPAARALQRAGPAVIQPEEPGVRNTPDLPRRYAVKAINRALQGITIPTV